MYDITQLICVSLDMVIAPGDEGTLNTAMTTQPQPC